MKVSIVIVTLVLLSRLAHAQTRRAYMGASPMSLISSSWNPVIA
jgi:hypothetical protein